MSKNERSEKIRRVLRRSYALETEVEGQVLVVVDDLDHDIAVVIHCTFAEVEEGPRKLDPRTHALRGKIELERWDSKVFDELLVPMAVILDEAERELAGVLIGLLLLVDRWHVFALGHRVVSDPHLVLIRNLALALNPELKLRNKHTQKASPSSRAE